MRRSIITAFALSFLLICFGVTAEGAPGLQEPSAVAGENIATDEIFAPFPLRIRVGIRQDGVVITWEDGSDTVTGYAIYRSESPIDRETFSKASRVAVVPFGVREYLDVPNSDVPVYYAVLGLTPEGNAYEVFIPLKNVSIAPVSFAAAPTSVPEVPPVSEASHPEEPPVLSAEAMKDGVRIVWTPVREGRRIVLYRSPAPIRSLSDLLSASWVTSAAESQDGLMDYPVPGIGFYYALVDDEGLRSGSPLLESGKNVTTSPVSIPIGLYRVGLPEIPYASRSLPLPFLALTKGVESGSGPLTVDLSLPSPAKLRPETETVLRSIERMGTSSSPNPQTLVVFPEDMDPGSSGGEQYTLRLIVKQRLSKQDWKGAADDLSRYLSLNRSPQAAARAHFYLGEALAFSGSYRDAFFEFLLSQDPYYAESNLWIDWILDQLPKNRTNM